MKLPGTAPLGAAALAGFAIHSATHIRLGMPEGMLWMCNMAALLVGAGLVLGRARPVAIGFSWLVVGNVVWGLDLLGPGELLPTSVLTHVLGFVLAWLGLRRLGFPARTWLLAGLAVIALQEITRLVSPERSNVNVVFSMYAGSEHLFPSFGVYRAAMLAVGVLGFALVEVAARRLFPEPPGEAPPSARSAVRRSGASARRDRL